MSAGIFRDGANEVAPTRRWSRPNGHRPRGDRRGMHCSLSLAGDEDCVPRADRGYVCTMVIYLAVAAGLVTLSLMLRVIGFALGLLLVGLVIDLATGHGPATATQLAHLL